MTYTVQENYMSTAAAFNSAVEWFSLRTCCAIIESGIYPGSDYWFIKSEHNSDQSLHFMWSSIGHLFFEPQVP